MGLPEDINVDINLKDDVRYDDGADLVEQRKALEKCFVAGPLDKRQYIINKYDMDWHPDRSIDPQSVVDQEHVIVSCHEYLPWLKDKLDKQEIQQLVYWISLCIRNEKGEQVHRRLEQCRVIGFSKRGEEPSVKNPFKPPKKVRKEKIVESEDDLKLRNLVKLTKEVSRWVKQEEKNM